MVPLKENYAVAVHLRVILPIAVCAPDYCRPGNEKWARDIQPGWPRRAEYLGRPHIWPDPDPIVQDPEPLKFA